MITELNELAKSLRTKYPNIDEGGCGIVAAAIAKHLEPLIGCNIKLVSSYQFDECIDDVRPKLSDPFDKTNWDTIFFFNHIVVEFVYNNTTMIFDASYGVVKKSDYDKHNKLFNIFADGSFTIQEMTSMSNQSHNWNRKFDHSKRGFVRSFITRKMNQIKQNDAL